MVAVGNAKLPANQLAKLLVELLIKNARTPGTDRLPIVYQELPLFNGEYLIPHWLKSEYQREN